MKKIEKRSMMVVLVTMLLCGTLVTIYFTKGNALQDTMKFKKEYEAYNNKNVNDRTYVSVDIKEDDQISYIAESELLDRMNSETAVFYFGFPTCPWCRNMIEPLLRATKENNVKLYYFNPSEARSGNSNIYLQLVKKLQQYLTTNEEGEKTLYVPDVYFVKDGQIVGNHMGTVDSQTDPYKNLSTDELKELMNIYEDNIKKMK